MTYLHEVPTDPTTLAALMADLVSPIDEQPDEIDAPRYRLAAEKVTADGRRIRTYTNRPLTTKETPNMDNHTDHSAEAIIGLMYGQPPRTLTTLEQETWTEATGVLYEWLNNDGSVLLLTTAEKLTADYLAAVPATPRALARVKVQKAMAALIARKPLRLAQVQIGDTVEVDPVVVLMACPEGSRLAADGYEAVALVWHPDGAYVFTDDETGREVAIPSLYRGMSSGYARVWRNIDDAVKEVDRLKDAVRAMRRLSADIEPDRTDDDDDTPPTAAASII